MSAFPAQAEEWPGPDRFLPPPEPRLAADGSKRYEGVTYAAAIGYRPLQLDLWVPAGENAPPLVVWIHGGAWLFGDRRYLPETLRPNQLFDELLTAGLAVATIDYRLSLEAKFPAQLHDAKAAVRYLRAHAHLLGIDTSRIGVWGESAGGHLAAMVGLTGQRSDLEGNLGVLGPSSAVDAVVDWYAPADMQAQPRPVHPPEVAARLPPELLTAPEDHLVGSTDPGGHAAASPVSYVAPAAPPFLLVHGTADTVVPFVHSELLQHALTSAGVAAQLVPIEGADHIFNGHDDIDAVVRLSVEFLAKALLRG
jgi:acetyl esterase/lipase